MKMKNLSTQEKKEKLEEELKTISLFANIEGLGTSIIKRGESYLDFDSAIQEIKSELTKIKMEELLPKTNNNKKTRI